MPKGLVKDLSGDKHEPGRRVLIIRHGQTMLNKEDKIRAWADVPLDDTGMEQAIMLGKSMKKEGTELDGICSSDLLRSVQTSLAISRETGIPIYGTYKFLRPLDVGTYTAKDGPMVHKIIAEHAINEPFEPIGNGESFEIFKHRFLTGVIGILNSNPGKVLGLTSHSRGERIMHAWVAAGCPEDLEIDMDEFLARGENTATAQWLNITCSLVLP